MGRFIDLGKHHAHPRTEAQKRANSAGGLAKDTVGAEDITALTDLLAAGAVRKAVVTTTVTGASGSTLGTGVATITAISVDDGITPTLTTVTGQTVHNPFPDTFAAGTTIGVLYTAQFYIVVTPAFPDISIATLIPIVPAVTGSKASGAALISLLTVLAALGIITDSTTA